MLSDVNALLPVASAKSGSVPLQHAAASISAAHKKHSTELILMRLFFI
jgi:hypothetical protein